MNRDDWLFFICMICLALISPEFAAVATIICSIFYVILFVIECCKGYIDE